MDDIIKDFLIESSENLDRMDQELVKLETDPTSKDLLGSIFRAIHSIKGSCGFLGFAHLEKVAHAGENLLSRLRDGELLLNADITSGLLAMVDAVRQMLAEIRTSGADGENDYPEVQQELKRLQANNAEASPPSVAPPQPHDAVAAPAAEVQAPDAAAEAPPLTEAAGAAEPQPAPPEAAAHSYRPAPGKMGGLLVDRGTVRPEDVATALHEQEHGDSRRLGEILVALGLCRPEDIAAAQHTIEARAREASTETVRVTVNLLDRMMNLVGELVLARNQLLRFSSASKDRDLRNISQRMNLIAAELQEQVMKTRMQPIGNVWNKFPRTVRDLAHNCGKEVRLEMEGQETELDRTVVEALKDPLIHLLRNGVDHGIEAADLRRQAGKDSSGVLKLRAFHESGQVNIEISDDGAGLNGERIRNKAVERGLITPQRAATMPDRDAFNLIFLPGFSTAEKVTNVSGRGVGMDVVKTNLAKIGGTVDIQSEAGKGTTIAIKIPLTLAIVPALVVRCRAERFAIPQASLIELVRLEEGKGLENAHGAPVYRLRGRLLPLVRLDNILGMRHAAERGSEKGKHGADMDFTAAREKHMQWLGRLEDMLAGKGSISIEQAGSPKECALGRWLYGEGLKRYSDIAEIHILEQTHRRFHEQVRNVVVAQVNGFNNRAQEAYRAVPPLTEKIVTLLGTLESKRAAAHSNINIAVLQAEGRQFGLVVDDILDSEEIVVKPLGKQLRDISAYSGATIMGDGSVALILDAKGLAVRAGLLSEARAFAVEEKSETRDTAVAAGERRSMIIAENGRDSRVAIPLGAVARLEELPASVIQRVGDMEVMHYRGRLIPLLRLSSVVPVAEITEDKRGTTVQVVVCSAGGHTVGLLVDRIVDIVEQTSDLESVQRRHGVTGTCMINRKVTDVLDIPAIVSGAVPDSLAAAAGQES